MGKWIAIAVFTFALAGLVANALMGRFANVTASELVSDSNIPAAGQTSADTTTESLGDIQFDTPPSGLEPVLINWRESPYLNFPFPNGSPLENFRYFRLLAESGNGFAAYQLADMMRSCSHTFLTRDELASAISRLRETFTYFDPERNAVVQLGQQADVNKFIEMKRQLFENCREFSAEQRQLHDHWLELSANNGYTLGMLDYGRQLDDLQASVELYRGAWRQGSGHALLELAEGLERIYDQGIDPTAKVPSCAALHAYVTLLKIAYGMDPERVAGRQTLHYRTKLDQMTIKLLPRELDEALRLSRQMINNNKNCCFEM